MPSSNPGPPTALPRPGDLRTKLVWLTMFRIVATTLLLAVLALPLLGRSGAELSREDSLSFALIGAVYVVNLIYGVLLRRGWGGRAAAYVQVLGDVVIATSLVYLSGGVESPFTVAYALAVVAASVLLQLRGALVAAAASSVALTGLAVAINSGAVRLPSGTGPLPLRRLAFALATNVVAQLLTAALAGYLSRQLSHAGGMLSAREEDLRKLDRLQRQILACMPSGLLTCDANGRVTFVNRAGAQILGIPPELESAPLMIEDLLPGILQLGAEGKRREVIIESKSGERVLGLTATALDDPGALLVVFQDLTDLRRLRLELERSDRLAALGKLSAQLAHEIRNPLASMRGSAQLLAQELKGDATTARLGNILVREADRLSRLVEEVLTFARPPVPQRRVTALDGLVRDTLQMLQADPLAAAVQLQEELAGVKALVDPDQFRQVLLNLLRNALQAAGPGGRVRVRLSDGPGGIRLHVWDSAGSIRPQDMQRLFEPFFTTRAGGTGLGLSTAHAIVRAHGGAIEVTSSRASGTEFIVGLPHASLEAGVADPGGG